MYAHLNAHYTQLAERHGVLDTMTEALSYANSLTDENNKLLSMADPTTLDTPDKRQRVYDEYVNTLTPLYRAGRCGHEVHLHPNLMLAKVEHWIRCLEQNTERYPTLRIR
jgi:hypothetical protein